MVAARLALRKSLHPWGTHLSRSLLACDIPGIRTTLTLLPWTQRYPAWYIPWEMGESYRGDPSGRRIARRRALLLAEAARLLRAVEVLLKRADVDPAACSDLIKSLAAQEQVQLQLSYGRIEPRKRFKHGCSHPLLEKRPVSNLYIDEGGKSGPVPADKPSFFSLAAVAMAAEEVDKYRAAADAIKLEFFGTVDITFHEPAMRKRDGRFYFQGDRVRQLQ